MSGRSPSNSGGVASLRARFEENSKHESPPSRGRSPAGSVTSDSSRPISKVRASFIAVEPMGDLSGTKEGGKTERTVTADGAHDDKPVVGTASDEGQGPLSTATGESSKTADGGTVEAKDVNPDKPTSIAEDTTATLLPSDPKTTHAVSSGDALAEDVADLGSILKGSSFETKPKPPPAGELKKHATPQKSAFSSHPQSAAKVSGPAKASAAPASPANGKPKEPVTKVLKPLPLTDKAEPTAPAPTATSISTSTPDSAPAPAPSSTSTEAPAPAAALNADPATAPALAPETAAPATTDTSPEKPEETEAAATEDTPSTVNSSTAKSAKAPTGSTTAAKATASNTNASAPKFSSQAKAAAGNTKPASRVPASKSSNEPGSLKSSSSRDPLVPPTKVNKPATKKTGPTSPTIPTKPRPKSPTRPVRLSSHLTAPTAASAAKLDHGAPATSQQNARSPSRTSNIHPTKPIASKPVSSLQQRTNRPPRASMPAAGTVSSKPLERHKARQSLAGGTKPSGDTSSFLERMMRPTQSSAQKTHDKVEVTGKHSPPSKKSTVTGGSRSTSLNLENKRKGPAADKARAAPPGGASAAEAAAETEEENGGKEDGSQTADSAAPEPEEDKAGENGVSADETAEQANEAEVPSSSVAAPTATAEKPLVPQPVVDAGETF